MEYDRQLLMTMYSEEELKKFQEECRLWIEEINRAKVEGDEDMNRKREEMMLEEMNIIAKEKMLRRRLMRHFRRRQTKKKISKSHDSESFTSDSDQEMKEEVKRLMKKAIQETLIEEHSKAEEMKKIEEDFKDDMIKNSKDEKMFPRRRGRLIRYVRRHSSKSQEEDFHIEFHHLQLPSDDEDDSEEMTWTLT